jgi:hypothetical protein
MLTTKDTQRCGGRRKANRDAATNSRGGSTSWTATSLRGVDILGAVEIKKGTSECRYVEHYPMGAPNQDVPEEIPTHIAEDFKEALRCMWVHCQRN